MRMRGPAANNDRALLVSSESLTGKSPVLEVVKRGRYRLIFIQQTFKISEIVRLIFLNNTHRLFFYFLIEMSFLQ